MLKLHIQFQKYFQSDFMDCVTNVYHEKNWFLHRPKEYKKHKT